MQSEVFCTKSWSVPWPTHQNEANSRSIKDNSAKFRRITRLSGKKDWTYFLRTARCSFYILILLFINRKNRIPLVTHHTVLRCKEDMKLYAPPPSSTATRSFCVCPSKVYQKHTYCNWWCSRIANAARTASDRWLLRFFAPIKVLVWLAYFEIFLSQYWFISCNLNIVVGLSWPALSIKFIRRRVPWQPEREPWVNTCTEVAKGIMAHWKETTSQRMPVRPRHCYDVVRWILR